MTDAARPETEKLETTDPNDSSASSLVDKNDAFVINIISN